MNKMDLMDELSKARLKAMLRRFNPDAQLIEATYSQVDPARILGTRLFELSKAEQHPEWAVLSDKRNGFNCISRRSIMAGLRRWYPELIPTFSTEPVFDSWRVYE